MQNQELVDTVPRPPLGAQFQAFLDALPVACAMLDAAGSPLYWNAAFVHLFKAAQRQDKIDLGAVLSPVSYAHFQALLQEATMNPNETQAADISATLSDLQHIRFKIKRSLLLGTDVTLLTATESHHPLDKDDGSGQRLQDLIESSVQGVVVYDESGPLFCTDVFAQLFGYESVSAFMTEGPRDEYALLVPEHREALQKLSQETTNTPFMQDEHFELRALKRDGEEIWIDLRRRAVTWYGRKAHLITVYDITRRKAVELRIHEYGTILQRLVDGTQTIIAYVDKDGYLQLVNRGFEAISGIKRTQAVGKHLSEIADANVMKRIIRRFERALQGQNVTFKQEITDINGNRKSLSAQIVPEAALDGSIRGAFIVAMDITDQEQAYKSLRISERRYRSLVEGSLQGIALLRGTNIIFANDACARMLGYPNFQALSEAPAAQNFLSCVALDDRPNMERALLVPDGYRSQTPRETKIILRDGRRAWIEYLVSPVAVGEEQLIQLTAIDITSRKLGEIALHESERLLRGLINASAALIACLDRDGRYIFANNHVATLVGIPADLLTGMRATDRMRGSRSVVSHEHFLRALQGESVVFQAEAQSANGAILSFECHYQPRWQGQDIVGVFVFAFDISERERAAAALKKSEERYRKLIEIMPYGISRTDKSGRLILCNPAHWAMLGYTPAELENRYYWEFFVPEEQAMHRQAYERIVTEMPEPYPNLGRCLRKDGKIIDVLIYWNYEYDENGEMNGFISVLTDVTEELKAKRELKHAKDMAEHASIEKSRFLASASHDLQQPIHSLSIMLELLKKAQTPERQAEIITMMERAVTGSKTLLQAVLDLSKLEAGVVIPHLQPIQLQGLFEEIWAELIGLTEGKPLEVRIVQCSAEVQSDRVLLKSIIHNLVSNAIRYTPKGKVLLGARKKGDQLEVQVWDTGKGIPEDRQPEIFKEFTRLERSDTDEKVQGLGLGLSIVERSCLLLGHELKLKSEVNKGSMFSVSMPLISWRGSRMKTPIIAQGQERPNAVILLIEDDPDVAIATRDLLEDWGYRCFVALEQDDANAIVVNEGQRPDLIIADFNLADNRTGIEVADMLYELLGRRIPTILITANQTEECIRAAKERNIPIIAKPASPARLRALISYCLVQEEAALE